MSRKQDAIAEEFRSNVFDMINLAGDEEVLNAPIEQQMQSAPMPQGQPMSQPMGQPMNQGQPMNLPPGLRPQGMGEFEDPAMIDPAFLQGQPPLSGNPF